MLTLRTVGLLAPALDFYSGMLTGGDIGREVAADHIVVLVLDNATVVGAVDEVRLWVDGAVADPEDASLVEKDVTSRNRLIVDTLRSVSWHVRDHALFTTVKKNKSKNHLKYLRDDFQCKSLSYKIYNCF